MAKIRGKKSTTTSPVIYVERAEFDRLMRPARRDEGAALRRAVQQARAARA